jgi:chromosome segregation ATPase
MEPSQELLDSLSAQIAQLSAEEKTKQETLGSLKTQLKQKEQILRNFQRKNEELKNSLAQKKPIPVAKTVEELERRVREAQRQLDDRKIWESETDGKVREVDDMINSVRTEITKQVDRNKDKKDRKFQLLKDIKNIDNDAAKLRKRCEAVIAMTSDAGEGFNALAKKFEERKSEISDLCNFCDTQINNKRLEEAAAIDDLAKKIHPQRAAEILAALAL